jgi:FecR protein
MTRCHTWTPRLLLVVMLALQSVASWAEDRIGVAASTKPNADGVTAGNSQTLAAGSEVYANETIRTGNLGQADLVFVDKTNLTVGPTSEVLLDKFVYDPTGAKSAVVFQATRGAFRFVTGTQDHRAYAVNTPYGSLGVRGTNVEIVTQPAGFCEAEKKKGRTPPGCECATKVRLIEGRAEFRTKAGKVAHLTEPNQTVCISPTGAISYGSSSTSITGIQEAGATPPPGGGTPPGGGGPGNGGGGSGPPVICSTPNQPNCVQP